MTQSVPGEDEAAATLALLRSGVIPAQRLGALIEHAGSAVRLAQLSEDDRLFAWPESAHDLIGAVTQQDLQKARTELVSWANRGLSPITVLDPDYPEQLHDIFNRPPLIFVRGSVPSAPLLRSVAIVGAREASEGARRTARALVEALVDAEFVVISGLARGIDTVAHTTALESGGTTFAVLGSGFDHIYPAENAPLADRIVDGRGGLLTQFTPEQTPTRWTFPMRNVVMSGLAQATAVIEASHTSGARLQARVAMQHGRTVFLHADLVRAHAWAAQYATEGAYGTRAIEIASAREIIERLESIPATTISTAA